MAAPSRREPDALVRRGGGLPMPTLPKPENGTRPNGGAVEQRGNNSIGSN